MQTLPAPQQPVLCEDGRLYDKASIVAYAKSGASTFPAPSDAPLPPPDDMMMLPNAILRGEIRTWKHQHGLG